MSTMSSIYDETKVSQPRVRYSPEDIKPIISKYANVLDYTVGENCSITFAVDGNVKEATRALKNTRFKKPVRIRTDGKTSITLDLYTVI